MVLNNKIVAQLEAALKDKDEHHVVYIPISFVALGNPATAQAAEQCAPSSFGLAVTGWLKQRYKTKLFVDRCGTLSSASHRWIQKVSILRDIELVARFPENGDRVDELLKKRVPQKVIELPMERVEKVVVREIETPMPAYEYFKEDWHIKNAFRDILGNTSDPSSQVEIQVRLDGDLQFTVPIKKESMFGKVPGSVSGLVYNYLIREGYDVRLVTPRSEYEVDDWLKRHKLREPKHYDATGRKVVLFAELMLYMSFRPGGMYKWEVGVLNQGEFFPPTEAHHYSEVIDANRHTLLRQVKSLVPTRSVIHVKAVPDLLIPRFVGYQESSDFPKKPALREGLEFLTALHELHHVRVDTRCTDESHVKAWLDNLGIRYHSLSGVAPAPDLPWVTFSKVYMEWLRTKNS